MTNLKVLCFCLLSIITISVIAENQLELESLGFIEKEEVTEAKSVEETEELKIKEQKIIKEKNINRDFCVEEIEKLNFGEAKSSVPEEDIDPDTEGSILGNVFGVMADVTKRSAEVVYKDFTTALFVPKKPELKPEIITIAVTNVDNIVNIITKTNVITRTQRDIWAQENVSFVDVLDSMQYSFRRGLANTLLCWVEIPRNLTYNVVKNPFYGFVEGSINGSLLGCVRLFGGLSDTLTLGLSGQGIYPKINMKDSVFEEQFLPKNKEAKLAE